MMTRSRKIPAGESGAEGESDDRYVMMRSDDHSIWARTSYIMEKYKLLVYLISTLLLAIGFNFKTPAMAVRDVQAQVTTQQLLLDNVIIPQQKQFETKLDILLRLRCIDHSLTDHDRELVGLDCATILNRR